MTKTTGARPGPLQGMKVVEMAGIGPGPFTAMLLADLGADVIRVERPNAGAPIPMGPQFDNNNRGRPRIALNLKNDADRASLWRLIEAADMLVEGFRPGVMERLGFGPDDCLARNAKLIFGRMTGWGQEGPLAHLAGHDLNYLGLTGAVDAFGPPGEPAWPPLNLVADFGGGGMYLAFGMMAAHRHAVATGVGQVVDAAMVDGASLLMNMAYGMRSAGVSTKRGGENILDGGAPFYAVYACKDGKQITLCCLEVQFYAAFLERAGLTDDPAFARQFDQSTWPVMKARLTDYFLAKTRDEWATQFGDVDACLFPVLSIDEAPKYAHNAARGTYETVDGSHHAAPGPRFSETPAHGPDHVEKDVVDVGQVLSAWSA